MRRAILLVCLAYCFGVGIIACADTGGLLIVEIVDAGVDADGDAATDP